MFNLLQKVSVAKTTNKAAKRKTEIERGSEIEKTDTDSKQTSVIIRKPILKQLIRAARVETVPQAERKG